jgi:DNA mismatch endonuclease (patch repair protein)
MADIFDSAKRSAVMALIRGSGNKDTELRMIMLFRAHGINGWRRNAKVFGKPDFIFPTRRIAVFVDGCFWHRHPGCKFCYTPKSRMDFWLPKFERNVARDQLVTRTLRKLGWKVIRVWQCELRARNASRTLERLQRALRSASCRRPRRKQA